METDLSRIPLTKRLTYAFFGLLAGNAVPLVYLLWSALFVRAEMLRLHIGETARTVATYLEMFAIYAIFSFIGWIIIGVPVVLFFSARFVRRLSWPLRVLVGTALGPLAVLVIFILLGRGHIDFQTAFRGTGFLWCYSIVVSTVAFLVYAALLHREEAL